MSHYKYIAVLMLLCSGMGHAAKDYWQCTTHDIDNNLWIAKSGFQKVAINVGYDSCKKQSKNPTTCKTAKTACEFFLQGVSTRPLWRCTALDRTAVAWKSNYYSDRTDAAFAAKAYCKDNSTVPETCYINMVTCFNVNERI